MGELTPRQQLLRAGMLLLALGVLVGLPGFFLFSALAPKPITLYTAAELSAAKVKDPAKAAPAPVSAPNAPAPQPPITPPANRHCSLRLPERESIERYAMGFFARLHYSRTTRAGIVGQFDPEAGVCPWSGNSAAHRGGGGVVQWEGNRWRDGIYPSDGCLCGLLNFASSTGNFAPGRRYAGQNHPGRWDDINVQLWFIDWELHHPYAKVLRHINRAQTPEAAASVVMKEYEKPRKGWTAHEDRRRTAAARVYHY